MKDKTQFEYWVKSGHPVDLSYVYAGLHHQQFSREQCWNRGKQSANEKCQQQKAELMMKHDGEIAAELKVRQVLLDESEALKAGHEEVMNSVGNTSRIQNARIAELEDDVQCMKRTIAILMGGE